MHDVRGALTRQYGVLGRMAAAGSRRGKSGQHRAGCPAKAGEARSRADSPASGRACGQPRESNRNGAGRFGGPDETGNPPCCNLRSGRTQPTPAADGGSPRPKVESSREGDDAARPGLRGGERWPSAPITREQNPAYAPDTPDAHYGASSSIGRAPACGAGCYGFEPREAPHFPFPRALVAQLDRASDFGSEGWGFESLRAYHRFFPSIGSKRAYARPRYAPCGSWDDAVSSLERARRPVTAGLILVSANHAIDGASFARVSYARERCD